MIAGLGKAAELVVQNIGMYHERMKDVRDYLESQLKVYIIHHLLHTLNLCNHGRPV